MKLNIRKDIWIFALAVVVTAFVAPTVVAAQSQQDQNRDQANRNDNANNLMYQQGLDHGQADRTNNQAHQYRLQPNNADDRRAYESGYDQGYQNGRDANPDYRGRMPIPTPDPNPIAVWRARTAYRMARTTACRIDRGGTPLVRLSVITTRMATAATVPACGQRCGALARIAQPKISTKRRTARPTLRDMKRAITASRLR